MSTTDLERWESEWRASSRLGRLEILRELLPEPIGSRLSATPPEFVGRATGLNRAGVVVCLTLHEWRTRCGVGLDTSLVHAFVDGLLGDARPSAETRLQVTPVEWGIAAYLAAGALKCLANQAASAPFPEATIDRVGPDAFDVRDLGPIVTVTWSVTLGEASGALRLWLPEQILAEWSRRARPAETVQRFELDAPSRFDEFVFDDDDDEPAPVRSEFTPDEVTGPWKVILGTITLPRGVGQLRPGRVLPLDPDPRVDPSAPLRLVWSSGGKLHEFVAAPDPASGGDRILLRSDRRLGIPPPKPELGDVALVESGRAYIQGAELERMGIGSSIRIDRDEEAPAILIVNDAIVARGVPIKIEDDPGVRLTEVG